jgi:hypothetical protein
MKENILRLFKNYEIGRRLEARVMLFNATFNNISVIFVRKLEFPEKTTDLPQVTDKPLHEWDSNSQLLVYVFC